MEWRIEATERGLDLARLLEMVSRAPDRVVLEQGGIPAAVLLPFDEYRRLQECNERQDWRQALDRLAEFGDRLAESLRNRGVELPPVDEMIREMREERDQQLMDNLTEWHKGVEDECPGSWLMPMS